MACSLSKLDFFLFFRILGLAPFSLTISLEIMLFSVVNCNTKQTNTGKRASVFLNYSDCLMRCFLSSDLKFLLLFNL